MKSFHISLLGITLLLIQSSGRIGAQNVLPSTPNAPSSLGTAIVDLGDIDMSPGIYRRALAISDPIQNEIRIVDAASKLDIAGLSPIAGSQPATGTFGTALAAADLDGDGFKDLVIGDPFFGNHIGRVTAYQILILTSGSSQSTPLGSYLLSGGVSACPTLNVGDEAGSSLSVVGHLPQLAGEREAVVVGSPRHACDTGRIDVIGLSGSSPSYSVLFLASQLGSAQGDQLGAAVSGGGDLDGDGFLDYAAGAPGAVAGNGSVQVWSGVTNLLLGARAGTDLNGRFGFSVSFVGDCNCDGRGDIAVGAPGLGQGASLGRVTVLSGVTFSGTPLFDQTGTNSDASLGYSVGRGGDVTGDGIVDVIVTEGLKSTAVTASIEARIIGGTAGGPMSFFSTASPIAATTCHENLRAGIRDPKDSQGSNEVLTGSWNAAGANNCGGANQPAAVASGNATGQGILTIIQQPTISAPPSPYQAHCLNSQVTISAAATWPGNPGQILYRWFKNGAPITNATTSNSYAIASLQFSDGGTYLVEVSSNAGAGGNCQIRRSQPVSLVVRSPIPGGSLTISSVPPPDAIQTNGNVDIFACESSQVSLSIQVALNSGASTNQYTWFKNGSPISTASNPTADQATLILGSVLANISPNNLVPETPDVYYVRVNNSCTVQPNFVQSPQFRLKVSAQPHLLIDQPAGNGSVRVLVRCVDPGKYLFVPVTFNPMNSASYGNGWFYGLWIDPNELFTELLWGTPTGLTTANWDLNPPPNPGLPFRMISNAQRQALYQLPAGAMFIPANGLVVTGVTLVFTDVLGSFQLSATSRTWQTTLY